MIAGQPKGDLADRFAGFAYYAVSSGTCAVLILSSGDFVEPAAVAPFFYTVVVSGALLLIGAIITLLVDASFVLQNATSKTGNGGEILWGSSYTPLFGLMDKRLGYVFTLSLALILLVLAYFDYLLVEPNMRGGLFSGMPLLFLGLYAAKTLIGARKLPVTAKFGVRGLVIGWLEGLADKAAAGIVPMIVSFAVVAVAAIALEWPLALVLPVVLLPVLYAAYRNSKNNLIKVFAPIAAVALLLAYVILVSSYVIGFQSLKHMLHLTNGQVWAVYFTVLYAVIAVLEAEGLLFKGEKVPNLLSRLAVRLALKQVEWEKEKQMRG